MPQSQNKSLSGKVAIVTGGVKGIGLASAIELAKKGANVVIADLDDSDADKAVLEITNLGVQSFFQKTDVTDPVQLTSLVKRCVESFGRLDIMFNNAGVAGGGKLLDWTPEEYRRVVSVNQDGVFYGIQAAARAMIKLGNGGVIINTGSIYGQLASLYSVGYNASKAAVENMTKSAALELAQYGIRVVNVAPGVTDTTMINEYRNAGLENAMAKKHLRRTLIKPEDVARVVAFLASDEAACVNGTTIYADDGFSVFK
ncbi:SDR family NAD(P)-dependent oxidoreductase [Aurantivibrio plasticivorans]